MVEKPNQDLKNMTRSLLHHAGFGLEYWSYALNHAVYLFNRLYHSTIHMTPYQRLRHTPPNPSHLRVFGSKVYYKHTKKNQNNLDISTDHGIFLGNTSTHKNVYIKPASSSSVLIGTHTSFDESHMSSPVENQPPMATAMREAGYSNVQTSPEDKQLHVDRSGLKVVLLSEDAMAPERVTIDSAGLDVFYTEDLLIEPQSFATTALDISIECRPGTYIQLQERSSLALKGVTLGGGVIDSDYRGNIHAILINNSNMPITIKRGQKFAQKIVKHIALPSVQIVDKLSTTDRGLGSFGSTDKKSVNASPPRQELIEKFPFQNNYAASAASAQVQPTGHDISFSDDPFDNKMDIVIERKGNHPTLGLDLVMCPDREQPRIIGCNKGETVGKIRKWRSTIKDGYVLAVNNEHITTISEIKQYFQKPDNDNVIITVGTMKRQSLHPQTGVP